MTASLHPLKRRSSHQTRGASGYLAFQDEAGATVFSHEGPSLEYLRSHPWTKGRSRHRQWDAVTVWLNLVSCWTLTYAAVEIMQTVWTSGRRTFIGPQDSDSLWLPFDLSPHDAFQAEGVGGGLERLTRPLFIEHQQWASRPRAT